MDSSANTYNLVHSKHGLDHDHNDNSHGDHDGVVITMILTMIIMAMAMEPLVTTLVYSNHGLGNETFATRNFSTCSKHLICTMYLCDKAMKHFSLKKTWCIIVWQ